MINPYESPKIIEEKKYKPPTVDIVPASIVFIIFFIYGIVGAILKLLIG